MLDRRQLLTGVIGGLLGSFALPRRSTAQVTGVTVLNDRLSLIATARTNVLALSTPDGPVCSATTSNPNGARYSPMSAQSLRSSSIISTRVGRSVVTPPDYRRGGDCAATLTLP